jgi:hypothetical protein
MQNAHSGEWAQLELGAHEKNRTSDLSLTKGVLYH